MCSARVGSNPIVIEFLVGQFALTNYYLFWFLGEVCPVSDHTICEDFILLRIQWFSLIISLFLFVFSSLFKSINVQKCKNIHPGLLTLLKTDKGIPNQSVRIYFNNWNCQGSGNKEHENFSCMKSYRFFHAPIKNQVTIPNLMTGRGHSSSDSLIR